MHDGNNKDVEVNKYTDLLITMFSENYHSRVFATRKLTGFLAPDNMRNRNLHIVCC
jgi:hypothetical protein